MFFKGLRDQQKATKKVKAMPDVIAQQKAIFSREKSQDRRRIVVLLGTVGVIGGALFLSTHNAPEDGPKHNTIPVTTDAAQPAGTPRCAYPKMTTDPEQTTALQEFLRDEGYLDEQANGIYDAETMAAVSEFQIDAKADGRYQATVDGVAGYLTCKAMGPPFFITD
jgi:hypothetical protein